MLPIPSFSGRTLREHGRSTGRRPPVLRAGSRLSARLFRFSESRQVDGLAPRSLPLRCSC